MGIKLLNTFIKSKCSNDAIAKIHIESLKGKKIAVDTSIYLYRYIGENSLIDNFYTLCSLFYKYEIIPIFIFDGKPPEEKNEELEQRKLDKKKAKEAYLKLETEYKTIKDISKKQELELKMDVLRKQFIKIKKHDIEEIKLLIQNFGFTYLNAIGEADTTCAFLNITNQVYAVMSEDMDLFAYGCNNIIRYFSLIHHNCVLYNVEQIINDLHLTKDVFKFICCISGNDYLKSQKNVFLHYNVIQKYNLKNIDECFEKMNIFDKSLAIENINKINNLFTIQIEEYNNHYTNINIINCDPNMNNLMKQLQNYGFMMA